MSVEVAVRPAYNPNAPRGTAENPIIQGGQSPERIQTGGARMQAKVDAAQAASVKPRPVKEIISPADVKAREEYQLKGHDVKHADKTFEEKVKTYGPFKAEVKGTDAIQKIETKRVETFDANVAKLSEVGIKWGLPVVCMAGGAYLVYWSLNKMSEWYQDQPTSVQVIIALAVATPIALLIAYIVWQYYSHQGGSR